eukprot:s3116_g5.t1
MEQRIQLSRSWAAWSPGLKQAIVVAMRSELNGRLKKLSLEQWKAHLRQDHQPFYRGCKTCLEACGQSRHHRRVVTPDSYTLAIDLAGPFKKGDDQLGEVSRSASDPGKVEGGIFDDCVDPDEEHTEEAAEDPLMEEEDHAAAATKDVKVDDTEKWKEKIEEEQGFTVKQITCVEILPDRSGPAVISGLSRIHARLRYMGLPLMRLHSDRAGELRSKAIRKWAEERRVYRTYTDGDSFKSNGRVEAEINMVKKQVRVLLKETGFNANLWPLAARHAAERRMRQQLEVLGCPTRPLLQFGREGYATQKIWNEKYQDWKMVRRKVTVMGPDVAMSASMPGYYVKGEDGKYFHSANVATAEGPPSEARLEEAELGRLQDHGVRRRITGKTPVLSRFQAGSSPEGMVISVEEN